MRRWALGLCAVAVTGAVGYFVITAPKQTSTIALAQLENVDLQRGAKVFSVAGCANCHISVGQDDPLHLGGGMVFDTPFGKFVAPNISMDPEHGIGAWDARAFYAAVKWGQSPDGSHYFPVFPYSAYRLMRDEDVAALWSYWQTLPAAARPSEPHDVLWPLSMRRNIGGWKWLNMPQSNGSTPQGDGAYVVEALAHCAQCHTPRNVMGGLKTSAWMRGAPNPSGRGRIPSIHPDDLGWGKEDIVEYLSSGFTPDYDMAGGKMVDVIESLAPLSRVEQEQIADYLLSLD